MKTFKMTFNTVSTKFEMNSDIIELRLMKWLYTPGKRICGNIQISDGYINSNLDYNDVQQSNPLKLILEDHNWTLTSDKFPTIKEINFCFKLTKQIKNLIKSLNITIDELILRSILTPVGVGSNNFDKLKLERLNAIDILLFNSVEEKEEYIVKNQITLEESLKIKF